MNLIHKRKQIKKLIFLSLFLLIIICPMNGCAYFHLQNGYQRIKREAVKARDYNVILICLDTLRADHLSCYGYIKKTSLAIDALSKNGVLFEQAFAQSNFTLPSLASLFTSKYVHNHKADRIERRLPENEVTLAELLRSSGYKTAAFAYNATQLNPAYGLNQGFDTYFFGEEDNRRQSFEKTLPVTIRWLETHKNDKFFIFLHSNDIHEPYHSPFENYFDPEYNGRLDHEYLASGNPLFHENNFLRTPREIAHIIAHYDGGIKYADSFIGKLMRQLKEWALLDKTIIIIFSDHGEILADRGMRFCHGYSLHDEEVRVPLIIMHPEVKEGVRINTQVQLIDVMPTLFDFLGISAESAPWMEGKSLINLIAGKNKEYFNKYIYAECLGGESDSGGIINYQAMVRTDSWKLITSIWKIKEDIKNPFPITIKMHNGAIVTLPEKDGFELYNLKKDKREIKNLTNKNYKRIEDELLRKIVSFTQ